MAFKIDTMIDILRDVRDRLRDFFSPSYGTIFVASGVGTVTPGANVGAAVIVSTLTSTGSLRNFTAAAGRLTLSSTTGRAGVYRASYNMQGTQAATAGLVTHHLFVNGSPINQGKTAAVHAATVTNCSFSTHVTLAPGDIVDVRVYGATGALTVVDGCLSLETAAVT